MNSCTPKSAYRGVRWTGGFMSTWYDVITLATPKGGTGKSTLSRGLAAYWYGIGRKPALVDADPTETLVKRYNPQGRLGAVPVVAEPRSGLARPLPSCAASTAP